MWLQLTIAIAIAFAAALLCRVAHAQPVAQIDTRSAVYQDSDHTTIITNNVAARGTTEHVGIEARYLVDLITSASVDVVAAATPAFHDTRHEIEGGLSYRDDYRKASGSYTYSTEHDWSSHTANAGFQQDVGGHDVTVRIGATLVANDVGRRNDPSFHRRLDVAGASPGVTFVLGPTDLLDVGYALSYLDGYQASPYRFVYFGGASGSPLSPATPESVPGWRLRHAMTIRWNHHMFADTSLRSHVRGYGDDWGIRSVTAGTEYVVGAGNVETGVFVRGYAQEHADFYRAEYPTAMRYMTADRELATFIDAFAGLRLGWRKTHVGAALEDLHAEAKLTGFAFRFFDFPRLQERLGAIAELALGVAF
jgi:hypothetical protein